MELNLNLKLQKQLFVFLHCLMCTGVTGNDFVSHKTLIKNPTQNLWATRQTTTPNYNSQCCPWTSQAALQALSKISSTSENYEAHDRHKNKHCLTHHRSARKHGLREGLALLISDIQGVLDKSYRTRISNHLKIVGYYSWSGCHCRKPVPPP